MSGGLPVEDAVPAVKGALAERGLCVLQAPPGAGKTTIVPLRLLDEPWLDGKRILLLEPRRLAARAAARRLAHLLGEGDLGQTIGLVTRTERKTSPHVRIEVVTEGVLTRRLQRDPELAGVGLVIFDEVHERNLQTDVGMALALDARGALRPDLHILVMSATLDGDRFARLLAGPDDEPAPIATSEGRTFPIEIRWAPPPKTVRVHDATPDVIRRALSEVTDGDVLVFLPGAGEIRRTQDALVDLSLADIDVRPLYGALPIADQDLALVPSPPGRRKVVLATDIAETSLTVEGVTIVVDAGLARSPRFDARTGLTRLTTGPASRASSDQRAGRAGRLAPGVAYRQWSKIEHAARRPYADPEITAVDLAGLAIELATWGDPSGESLRFLDRPPKRALDEARTLLRTLGLIEPATSDHPDRPTATGKRVAELPLHPRLARMVALAVENGPGMVAGDGWVACMVAALLEERDVLRGRPDDLPVDLADRINLLADPRARHPQADIRAVRATRDRAKDLARRAGLRADDDPTSHGGPLDPSSIGRVTALAFPDRVAQARGGARFRMRLGAGGWVPQKDPVSTVQWIVAADVDGGARPGASRAGGKVAKDARIRMAAVLDPIDVEVLVAADPAIEERSSLVWDEKRDELVARVERRLGSLDLGTSERRPTPGPSTTAALVARVKTKGLNVLGAPERADELRARVAFVAQHRPGQNWPNLTDDGLMHDVDDWLCPLLAGAIGRADLANVDLAAILRGRLDHRRLVDLDRLAPTKLTLPSGRAVALDYTDGLPSVSARVQELFGLRSHPTVVEGAVAIVVTLLSPAGRPIQITGDLPGFWAGSWKDVKKDMAGRYPKHSWPDDPAAAQPPQRG